MKKQLLSVAAVISLRLNLLCHGVWWPLTYLFSDLQRSLAQRLCFLVLSPLPIQDSQVVEGGSDLTGTQTHSSFQNVFQTWRSASTIFTHVCSVQRQDSTSAAWSHWSGEKIINDVRKQEVITVGCNLIPIMYVESPTCALRRKERHLEVTSDVWFRQALVAMWTEWEERRAEGWGDWRRGSSFRETMQSGALTGRTGQKEKAFVRNVFLIVLFSIIYVDPHFPSQSMRNFSSQSQISENQRTVVCFLCLRHTAEDQMIRLQSQWSIFRELFWSISVLSFTHLDG